MSFYRRINAIIVSTIPIAMKIVILRFEVPIKM